MGSTATQNGAGAYPILTDKDLWGADGRPDADDVRQKNFGDCYLVAAAGEVARVTPEVIRSNVSFDPHSGQFGVRLFKDGQWTDIAVSQEELRDNLARRGGSTFVETASGRSGALWPAVYEVGYAKLVGGSWEQGREMIIHGGYPAEALQAVTGKAAVTLDIDAVDAMGPKAVAERITEELAQGRRVVMSTRRDPWQDADASLLDGLRARIDGYLRPGVDGDGVIGKHAYMVLGARYDEQSGETYLRLRNPWGHNRIGGTEAQPAAEIGVKLSDLLDDDTRSLGRFDIARLPAQQRGLLESIRDHVGPQAAPDAVALAAVQASREGITSADQLRAAGVSDDGRLWVEGATPGYRAIVDTRGELPPLAHSLGALAQEGDRLQQAALSHESQALQRA